MIPVIAEPRVQYATSLIAALRDAAFPVIEITQRHPEAISLLERMCAEPDLLVGAGTVIDVAQAQACVNAGARFLVSPGFSTDIARFGKDQNIVIIPGVATASEVMGAVESGSTTVKFFPAGQLGGPAGLRAMSAVFPKVSFIPTGGVTIDNLADYLAIPGVPAAGGTWVFPPDLLRSRNTVAIAELLIAARTHAARFSP